MSSSAAPSEDFDDVPLSALLRSAQDTYTAAADRALSRAGYGDLPRAGSFIVSAMNWSNASLEAVIRWMGVSKQAVSRSASWWFGATWTASRTLATDAGCAWS